VRRRVTLRLSRLQTIYDVLKYCKTLWNIETNQWIGTATEPQRYRKFCQFNHAHYYDNRQECTQWLARGQGYCRELKGLWLHQKGETKHEPSNITLSVKVCKWDWNIKFLNKVTHVSVTYALGTEAHWSGKHSLAFFSEGKSFIIDFVWDSFLPYRLYMDTSKPLVGQ